MRYYVKSLAISAIIFSLAGLAMLLTEGLARYGYQLVFGKLDNRRFDPNINVRRDLSDGGDPTETIQLAIDCLSLRGFLRPERA